VDLQKILLKHVRQSLPALEVARVSRFHSPHRVSRGQAERSMGFFMAQAL
jgi:hypothetical protein